MKFISCPYNSATSPQNNFDSFELKNYTSCPPAFARTSGPIFHLDLTMLLLPGAEDRLEGSEVGQ